MPDNKDKKNEKALLDRRQFLRLSAVSAGVVAAGSLVGCGNSSSSATKSATPVPKSVLPSASAWKFGVMSDTQWTAADDGENPASCAVDIINQLNTAFIAEGVQFVVHVGDLNDDASYGVITTAGDPNLGKYSETTTDGTTTYYYSPSDAYGVRARYAQALYNEGIGFFPLRGNHDQSQDCAVQFKTFFPQTQTGLQNDQTTQTAAYSAKNPDTIKLPAITRTNTASFTIGTGFSSPTTVSNQLAGLSYSFKANGATFMMLDQFTLPDGTIESDETYLFNNVGRDQQTWVNSVLSSRASGSHAFVFSHKGLLTQNHSDILFGSPKSGQYVDTTSMDTFIKTLEDNNVKYLILGHDHMHDRSMVYTSDGTSNKVMQLVTSSDSSKFYIPQTTSNDTAYWGGKRQKLVSQELLGIGYYIVTVDGEHVTIDYYSATSYATGSSFTISTTPDLVFTKRETFGYSLKGKDFLVPYGSSYTSVDVTSTTNGTRSVILSGTCLNSKIDMASRNYNVLVNTGYYDKDSSTDSDILYLRGMDYIMGSAVTDTFALSMSYTGISVTDAMIKAKSFGLARLNDDGVWEKAVNANSGGTEKFVNGSYASGYGLGTWGIDTTSKTVWAVINSNGYFAAVNNI